MNLSGAGATNAWANMSAYCSSKAAVVRLTEVLALELVDTGITVNALGPGSVHTRMWDELTDAAAESGSAQIHETGLRVQAGRGASIDRCADLAVWLASNETRALSGRIISAFSDDFESMAEVIRLPAVSKVSRTVWLLLCKQPVSLWISRASAT